ncbi:hypothetical protein KUTeg_005038 [Tegillarca granosa]|uniref:HTH psq-type domain-containing protein n=1 Tax=Tegillarca granosa TaxID=220873 RepID=A0ABQ9FIM6_TEGGR|nr:hypothetical protein KUTeg_005038 [Tegillarca granosa]
MANLFPVRDEVENELKNKEKDVVFVESSSSGEFGSDTPSPITGSQTTVPQRTSDWTENYLNDPMIFRVLQGYRNYDPSKLDSAYKAVKEDKISVHGAAKRFGVPVTTLRDRVDGRIHIDCCTIGAPPLFTLDQEAAIFNHIKIMSEIGYGYTRSEVVDIASDYAIDLGLKERGNDLSLKWYYGFMKRWPELSCNMPSGLSELRARAVTPERIGRYFIELDTILEKYSLKDKPHLIYNVDEKGIITGGGKRPKIVKAQKRPQVVTSERSQTTTVFGC